MSVAGAQGAVASTPPRVNSRQRGRRRCLGHDDTSTVSRSVIVAVVSRRSRTEEGPDGRRLGAGDAVDDRLLHRVEARGVVSGRVQREQRQHARRAPPQPRAPCRIISWYDGAQVREHGLGDPVPQPGRTDRATSSSRSSIAPRYRSTWSRTASGVTAGSTEMPDGCSTSESART